MRDDRIRTKNITRMGKQTTGMHRLIAGPLMRSVTKVLCQKFRGMKVLTTVNRQCLDPHAVDCFLNAISTDSRLLLFVFIKGLSWI